jgi:hypothetical protein
MNRLVVRIFGVEDSVALSDNIFTKPGISLSESREIATKEKATKVSFKTNAYKCPYITPDPKMMTSQFKEDHYLLKIFSGICNGTYVEMGALDGVRYSNTHVFHKELGWKGVLVEISPRNFAKLEKNRPNELALVHAGVCAKEGMVHFMEMANGAVSGVWEFAMPSFRDQWWKGKTIADATPIRCVPLRTILADQGPAFFADFFSLDVEGAELQALSPPSLSSAPSLPASLSAAHPPLPSQQARAHPSTRPPTRRGAESLDPRGPATSAFTSGRRRCWSRWTRAWRPSALSSSKRAPTTPPKTPPCARSSRRAGTPCWVAATRPTGSSTHAGTSSTPPSVSRAPPRSPRSPPPPSPPPVPPTPRRTVGRGGRVPMRIGPYP